MTALRITPAILAGFVVYSIVIVCTKLTNAYEPRNTENLRRQEKVYGK